MKAIAAGIYELDSGSFRAVARVGDRRTGPPPKEKRFPVGTSLREMKRWQENERAELRRTALRPVLGSLAADIERYLRLDVVTNLASYRTRVTDTKAWLPRFGHLRRDELTTDALQRQVNDWAAAGVAAWTIHHRRNALRQVFKTLDGETAVNPAARLKVPSKPRAVPHALDYFDIRSVFNQLRPSATKGFLLIIAFTGFRPEEIRRTEEWMVRVDADEPHVIKNSAKGGDLVVVPLSPEGVLGWKMFVEHGGFDKQPDRLDRRGHPCRTRTFVNSNRDWKHAMERAGFAPSRAYNLVHSYCVKVLQASGDITVVQKLRGHRNVATTMIYTQVTVDPRLAVAVGKAFSLTPDARKRVAGSRGSTGK